MNAALQYYYENQLIPGQYFINCTWYPIVPVDNKHTKMPQKDATKRCHKKMPQKDATKRCHKKMPQKDATKREKTVLCVYNQTNHTLISWGPEFHLRRWVCSLDNNRPYIITSFLVMLIVAAITVWELKINHKIEANYWVFNVSIISFTLGAKGFFFP